MTSSTMPIPPIQCVKHRQNWMGSGSTSTSARMVAPVVVNPEAASKNASVKPA